MSNEDNSNKAAVASTPDTTWMRIEQRREALGHAIGLGHNRFSTDQVVEAAEQFRKFLAGEDSAKTEEIQPPTEPGFYKYSGGNDVLIFLLRPDGTWYTWFDTGEAHECAWGYIEQALSVWDLEKI